MLLTSYISLAATFFLMTCLAYKVFVSETGQSSSAGKPHFIFMLADDLGWNDVGYHNSDMLTPNIDSLSADGIRLNQSYVQYLCTPSRAAIMTGYYPHRTGMQHGVIWRITPCGLPLQFNLLPAELKKLGYGTHMVGKWHLGHCHWNYTPTYRGFDSFFGSLSGSTTHFTHQLQGQPTGHDYRNNTENVFDYDGIFNSIPFLLQVEHILSTHSPADPLFLYLPFHLPHSPLEVPMTYTNLYMGMPPSDRKTYSAMVSAMDDDVGTIVNLLKKYDFYRNSIIVFLSDNGGQVYSGGNNFPLRGNKNTLYEGGTRTVGFVHSAFLVSKGYVYNGLIHAVDWFASLISVAGGNPDPDIDGVNVWPSIIHNMPSPRKEFVYNIDPFYGNNSGAIRVGDWKLIVGKAGLPADIFTPANVTFEYAKYANGDTFLDDTDAPSYRLYNLKDDPSELTNLANSMPAKVDELLQRFNFYDAKSVEPIWRGSLDPSEAGLDTGILSPGYCQAMEDVQLRYADHNM